MNWKLAIAALLVAQGLLAQTAEFDRVSGGEIAVVTKEARKLSGTLGMSSSRSDAGFGSLKGFEGTLGGTIVDDRLWFFAAASRSESLRFISSVSEVAQPALTNAVDAKVMTQLGSRQDLSASFSSGRELVATSPVTMGAVPSTFLSLRYTGIVSSNMFFNVSVVQSATGR
jgi:hypothetical protein